MARNFVSTGIRGDSGRGFGTALNTAYQMNQSLRNQEQEAENAAEDATQQALEQYQTAYDEAKQANEERYQRLLGMSDKLSNQRATDIRTQYQREQAKTGQKLANLGMQNTTIAPTLRTGYQRDMQGALNEASNVGTRRKMDIMQSRSDVYPQRSQMLDLVRYYGKNIGA